MKKSKVILAVVLAVVLLVTILNAPTFSWFTRPKSQSGENMLLGVNGNTVSYSVTAYNGKGVTLSTNSSATGVAKPVDSYDGNSCYTDVSDNLSNTDILSLSGSGIGSAQRKYFCTTITNGSGDNQNVSLYVRTLSIPTSSNGSLALGVNGPTRSYHDYSSLATPSKMIERNSMRIYFQKPKYNTPSGWTGTDFYICWNEDTHTDQESLDGVGSNGTYYKMTYCGEKDGYYNYYADIPGTATHAFFAVENWAENKPVNQLTAEHWKKRTQTLRNLAGDGQTKSQSKVYKLTGTVTNGNTTVHTPPYTVTGNNIYKYYANIFVAYGNTFNASSGIGATGTLRYYSSDTSVFEVNETTGVISPKNVTADAILYTKSIGGDYEDEQQVETVVHVTASPNYVFSDVPIVKNIQIPAGEEVKVYWYIINNSNTTALSYTIDELYVGL